MSDLAADEARHRRIWQRIRAELDTAATPVAAVSRGPARASSTPGLAPDRSTPGGHR